MDFTIRQSFSELFGLYYPRAERHEGEFSYFEALQAKRDAYDSAA